MRRQRLMYWVMAMAFLCTGAGVGAQPAEQDVAYEIGGPLAGVKLPLYQTQHGEPAGHPGVIPGEHDDEGLPPELELSPGAVEHWRAYMFKYMPIRSFFDQQSQVKNFVAPEIPGARAQDVRDYAEPVYFVPRHAAVVNTGRTREPVPVVVMNEQGPRLTLDLGELQPGLYAVRVIGAVPTDQLRTFRKTLILSMQINDQPDGGQSVYDFRTGYVDEFYPAAEFYFHATEARQYQAEIWVPSGEVDLYVHNVSVDDVLAGTERRAIKSQVVHATPRPRPERELTDDRLERDAMIWNFFPPLNAQGSGNTFRQASYQAIAHTEVTFGLPEMTNEQVAETHGNWTGGHGVRYGERVDAIFPEDYDPNVFIANEKLGLTYTFEDLRNNRPLPDPYPYKDNGVGLIYPDAEDEGKGHVWAPIATEVMHRIRHYPSIIAEGANRWRKEGDAEAAHDASIALARFAYQFPTIMSSDWLCHIVRDPSAYGRNLRNRRRETEAMWMNHYANYEQPVMNYDRLFDYIEGNEALAESVGRFVPWVEMPEDVVELIDVYLVQTLAKRVLRYHYHTSPMTAANLATILNDTSGDNQAVTDDWMQWMFARTFIYPLPPAGIQDTMITGTGRNGVEYIGSSYYGQGEGALRVGESLKRYLATGGNVRYDITDPKRYPKPLAQAYWQLDHNVAGHDFLRIGDVAGPDKAPGTHLGDPLERAARNGWEWSQDPQFAYLLKHYFGRDTETDAEWQQIQDAADHVSRAPWLDLHSRVLPMWAGILETGHQHDDHRFRRAAYLRVGYGYGHHHGDTLDLQLNAHGGPFMADNGQRPGYTSPGDRSTLTHNTAVINNSSHTAYSWVRSLSDHDGARYLSALAEPPAGATLLARQIALVDVDEGEGSQPLTPEQQAPRAKLPEGVTTANSYVFDVFRLDGGQIHTYAFHGTVDDDFQWNARDEKKVDIEQLRTEVGENRLHPQRPLLSHGRGSDALFTGSAPDKLQATWRISRTEGADGRRNIEQSHLGPNYDENAPRRFTRLHLLGVDGARAMHAPVVCHQWDYDFTNLMVSRSSEDAPLSGVFTAVIEPYVGKPFITDTQTLTIPGNESDAQQAVAVRVTTANGHNDVLFADGRPDQVRTVPDAQLEVAGEFALYATDGEGLRQATLTGGTKLAGPDVRIETAQRDRSARIVAVDYLEKQMVLDADWPAQQGEYAFEVGQFDLRNATSYHATSTEPAQDGQTRVTVDTGADYYRSEVIAIDPATGEVTCTLTPINTNFPGRSQGWVASNDDMTQFWRAEYLGGERFRLSGGPVSKEAFGDAGVLRLWEYGVDDQVRQSTSVSLRRNEAGTFQLTGNVDLTLALRGKGVQRSADGKQWQPARTEADGEWQRVSFTAEELSQGPIHLRIER